MPKEMNPLLVRKADPKRLAERSRADRRSGREIEVPENVPPSRKIRILRDAGSPARA